MRYPTKRKQSSCQSNFYGQANWWTWWLCFWAAYWIFQQWFIALGVVGFIFLIYTAWKRDWLHRRKPTIIYVSKPVQASTQEPELPPTYEQGYQALSSSEGRASLDIAYNQYEQPQTQYPEQEPPGAIQ